MTRSHRQAKRRRLAPAPLGDGAVQLGDEAPVQVLEGVADQLERSVSASMSLVRDGSTLTESEGPVILVSPFATSAVI